MTTPDAKTFASKTFSARLSALSPLLNRSSLSASNIGLRSDGPTTTVRIGTSVIFGNVTGVVSANGGALQSYGNNQLNGNTTDGSMSTIGLH